MLSLQIWNSLPEKIKSVANLVDFKNSAKIGAVLNVCATYVLLKIKMLKIGHENSSLHTTLINSLLSNIISILITLLS